VFAAAVKVLSRLTGMIIDITEKFFIAGMVCVWQQTTILMITTPPAKDIKRKNM
jgi:hypothetical protein